MPSFFTWNSKNSASIPPSSSPGQVGGGFLPLFILFAFVSVFVLLNLLCQERAHSSRNRNGFQLHFWTRNFTVNQVDITRLPAFCSHLSRSTRDALLAFLSEALCGSGKTMDSNSSSTHSPRKPWVVKAIQTHDSGSGKIPVSGILCGFSFPGFWSRKSILPIYPSTCSLEL